jgi:hypothetical protein
MQLVQPLCAPHLSVNISKKQSTLLQITKMRLPAIIPSALLGVAFVFAVIELGLGGHIASISTGSRKIPFYDPSSSWGYSYKTIKYSVPGIVAFQIFTSVWTMLVSVAAFLLPWFLRVKAAPGTRLNTIITGALGGAYFVTMVFWLACFADIATKLDELGATSDYYNAVIAFAVLSWLVYFLHTHLIYPPPPAGEVDVANASEQAALCRALRHRCSCHTWDSGV